MCFVEKESTFPELKHSEVAKLYSSHPKIETITLKWLTIVTDTLEITSSHKKWNYLHK